jgi:hypothetical protein
LSTLKGVIYFSPSRRKNRIFYVTSAIINNPEDAKPVPDPTYDTPPAELTLYADQKDRSFGDNIYKYTYYAQKDALIFTQENLTTMTYGIIPAVGKRKLRSIVTVIDAGDSLVVYICSMVKAPTFPGLTRRAAASFAARAKAVLNWFIIRADKAYGG